MNCNKCNKIFQSNYLLQRHLKRKNPCISNDILITGSSEKTIKIWDIKCNKLLNTLIGHNHTISCLAAISDDRICSGSWDGTIKIWDLASSSCLQTISNAGNVYSLKYF